MMQDMLGNKWIWLAAVLVVPFFVIWIAESLLMAIVVYAVFGGMFLFFKIQMGQRRGKRDDGDVYIYLDDRREEREQRRGRRPKNGSPIVRAERDAKRRIRRRGL